MSNPSESASDWAVSWGIGVACSAVSTVLVYYATRQYVYRSRTKRKVLKQNDLGARGAQATVENGMPSAHIHSAFQAQSRTSKLLEDPKRNPFTDPNAAAVDVKSELRQAETLVIREQLERVHPELRRTGLLKIGAALIVAISFEFAAMAIVALALIIPLTMLYFLWRHISLWIRREALLEIWETIFFFFIMVSITMTIYGGPHDLYILDVSTVFVLDQGTIIYIACFTFLIISPMILLRSKAALTVLASRIHLPVPEFEAILVAALAGILGSQAFLMIKLLAEIAAGSVFGKSLTGNGFDTFLILGIAVLLELMHLYYIRIGLRLQCEPLVIPLYRLFFIISGTIAATIFLKEFYATSSQQIVVYSVGLFLDLILCCYLAATALKATLRGDLDSILRREGAAGEDFYGDIEMGIGEGNNGPVPESKPKKKKQRNGKTKPAILRSKSDVLRSSLSNGYGLMSKGRMGGGKKKKKFVYKGPGDQVGDSDDFQSLASDMPSSESSKKRSHGRASGNATLLHGGRIDGDAMSDYAGGRFSDDENDSDDSNGSFHSLPSSFHTPRSLSKGTSSGYNYHYDPPEESMVQPRDTHNPYAAPGTSYWWDCGAIPGLFKIRGPNYLSDGIKVKADTSCMRVVAMEWSYHPEKPIEHIAAHPNCLIQKQHAGKADRPFLFVLNFMVPTVGNYVTYFARREQVHDPLFDYMFKSYIEGDDANRNKRFKIIPGVPEGSFFVKKAVGQKPALICDKVPSKHFYNKEQNYFETCIDVGSSKVAASVMGAVKGFASTLTLQLGYTIEPQSDNELPERLLGAINIHTPSMQPPRQLFARAAAPPVLVSSVKTASGEHEEEKTSEGAALVSQ